MTDSRAPRLHRLAPAGELDRAPAAGAAPVPGKHTGAATPPLPAELTPAASLAFLARALDEAAAQLPPLAASITASRRLAAVTAAGGLRRSLGAARAHLAWLADRAGSADEIRAPLAAARDRLERLQPDAERTLAAARAAGLIPAPPAWEPLAALHLGAGAAPALAAARPGSRPPELYLAMHERALWASVRQHLQQAALPRPHARLAWHDEARFVDATVARLGAMGLFDGPAPLREVLAPADPYAAIAPHVPAGRDWAPAVGAALAGPFERAIGASLQRLGARWIELADRAGEAGPHDERTSHVTAEALIPSHPIDLAVRRGLTAGLVVDLAVPVGRAAPRPPPGRPAGLRPVRLAWQGARDPALWNVVRAVEPADASAEEVAAALWLPAHRGWDGPGSIYAGRLVARPPLFHVPPALAQAIPAAQQHAPDRSHVVAAAARIRALLEARRDGWDRDAIAEFERLGPADRIALQRQIDLAAVIDAMGDFEAARLGTLGPVIAGGAALNQKRAAFIAQAIRDYAPSRAQVFILFVLTGAHDDDVHAVLAELANRRRIADLRALPAVAQLLAARGIRTDGYEEPSDSWTSVFPAMKRKLREAIKDPRVEHYRSQANQLPSSYRSALWQIEDAELTASLTPGNIARGLVDHITFGIPLGAYELVRGTAGGLGSLVDREYEKAGEQLAGAALVLLAHLGVKAWHVVRGSLAATGGTGAAPAPGAAPAAAGGGLVGPAGPGQFTIPGFRGPITAAEARAGAIFALNAEAQAALGRILTRVGRGGLERAAALVRRDPRAAAFIAEHGELGLYALVETGDVVAARTRLPSRQLAAAAEAAPVAAGPTRAQIEADFATHAKNVPNEAPGAFENARGKLALGAADARVRAASQPLYEAVYREAYFEARGAGLEHHRALKRAGDQARKQVTQLVHGEAEAIARERARGDLGRISSVTGLPEPFIVGDARLAQAFADYRAGTRGATARQVAPLLPNKSLAEMESLLRARGGTRTPPDGARTVAQGTAAYAQIEYAFADGTLVRIKPRGSAQEAQAKYSVELQHAMPSAAIKNLQDNIAFKIDAAGRPIPKGKADIKNPYSSHQSAQRKAYEQEVIAAGHLDAGPSEGTP